MNQKIKKRRATRSDKKQRNLIVLMVAIGIVLVVVGIGIAGGEDAATPDLALTERSGQASLKVDRELIDFGDVKLNTNLTFEIEVTNVGDQPLEFSRTPYVEVKEGC